MATECLLADGAEPCPGATCVVLLRDAVGNACRYTLRDVRHPPHALRLKRPAGVPPIGRADDPAWIRFEWRGAVDVDTQLPIYDQVV